MEAKLDNRTDRPVPPEIIETLEASVRDIATGAVSNANDVQAEMRRMLADYERSHAQAPLNEQPKRNGTA